ncbi:MAG: terminase small subunit [Fastidiosipilaceae bacterium]|jgi:phage terminase small subunit
MPKKPDWEKIRQEWEANGITLKALAEKHGVKLGTLKSRKSREKWTKDATKKDAASKKKVATKKGNKKNTERPVIENNNLTDKQRLFCLYYLKYFNATKAYQKAYKCSYEVANKNAYSLMVNHGIKSKIEQLKQERFNGVFLDAKAVLQKYIDIAFADITDYVEFGQEEMADEQGNRFNVNRVKFRESADVDGTIITEVKQGKNGVSIKLADKMKALEFLSKYADLLSDSDRKRLQDEKLKAETELTKERTKLIKGEEKDLSLLEELFRVSGYDNE